MLHFIKHHRGTLVATIFLCIITMLTLSLYSLLQKDITVRVDEDVFAFKVTSNTVEELLYYKNIQINDEDYISHELDKSLENGMEIVIKKAIPITVYNEELKMIINSSANTVKEVIESMEIEIDENDIITPPFSNSISQDSVIRIIKVDEELETIKEEIPFNIIEKYSSDLFKGKELVAQNGENGLKEISILRRYENGKLVSEITESTSVIKEPVDEIIKIGTKELLASPRGNITYDKAVVMVATAYDLSYASTGKNPGDKNYGITASGTKARPGVVAVDPTVIPLGTKLYIESLDSWPDYGFAVAEDTGGAIKGNKIDLFMADHSQAFNFGRRKVKVYILD